MRSLFITLSVLFCATAFGQFPGIVGSANCNALHTDSNVFVAWGAQCKITRGYQDISNTSLGLASVGDSSYAVGKADAGVVSLGDRGSAIITFSAPITNAPGFDFAVFENSFNDSFLELAFVEVSSDGVNYVRFPSVSNLPVSPQFDNNANMDASTIHNLAGKYRALYGTPFDLEELSGHPLIDISAVTHVRIIDVVGNINQPFASFDSQNHVINDPWPTPYASSGFDLDAVGVIHQKAVGVNEYESSSPLSVYPNPAKDRLIIEHSDLIKKELTIYDLMGSPVLKTEITSQQQHIDVSALKSGVYFMLLNSENGKQTRKLIIE